MDIYGMDISVVNLGYKHVINKLRDVVHVCIKSPTCSGPKTSLLCHVPRFIKGSGSEKLTAINDLTKTLAVRKSLDCGLVHPHVLMAFVQHISTPCWLLAPPFKIARMTVFITVQFERFPTWTSCGCRSSYRSLLRGCWRPPYLSCFVNKKPLILVEISKKLGVLTKQGKTDVFNYHDSNG